MFYVHVPNAKVDPDYYQSIHGWFDFAELYDAMIAEAQPVATFVELGAWLGRSTAYMASRIAMSSKPINFSTVDLWVGLGPNGDLNTSIFPEFLSNMVQGGLADFVNPLRMYTEDAAVLFEDESLDFVFLDACDLYEGCAIDIKLWWPKVKPGGVMAGDNYHQPPPAGVSRAVKEAFGDDWTFFGPSWFKRKSLHS